MPPRITKFDEEIRLIGTLCADRLYLIVEYQPPDWSYQSLERVRHKDRLLAWGFRYPEDSVSPHRGMRLRASPELLSVLPVVPLPVAGVVGSDGPS